MHTGLFVAAGAAGIITVSAVMFNFLSQALVQLDEGHFDVFGEDIVG